MDDPLPMEIIMEGYHQLLLLLKMYNSTTNLRTIYGISSQSIQASVED